MKKKELRKMRPHKWKPRIKSLCKQGVGEILTAYKKTHIKKYHVNRETGVYLMNMKFNTKTKKLSTMSLKMSYV